jgi:hypothetical protein
MPASGKPLSPPSSTPAEKTATAALTGLVCLVVGQVHTGTAYVGVLLAVPIIVSASTLLCVGLGQTSTREGTL